MSDLMTIEIAYAFSATQQTVLTVNVSIGCTVETAITQSAIMAMYPNIDLNQQKVGVFNRLVGLDHILQAHDRIEIYRPLQVDPKTARRRRALKS